MVYIKADDGRILISPRELKLLLKGSFTAFIHILAHIRFYYMADEIWNGRSSLVFEADGEKLAAITLNDGAFNISFAGETFQITDETMNSIVYDRIEKTTPSEQRRPFAQLTMNLNDSNQFACGAAVICALEAVTATKTTIRKAEISAI